MQSLSVVTWISRIFQDILLKQRRYSKSKSHLVLLQERLMKMSQAQMRPLALALKPFSTLLYEIFGLIR